MKPVSFFCTLLLMMTAAGCKGTNLKEPPIWKTDMHKILHYASLAGSSHNSQPWKTEVFAGDSICIYADHERNLAVVDPSETELYISLGAFTENLAVAAENMGYRVSVTLQNNQKDKNKPAVTVSLEKSAGQKPVFSLADLEQRCTLRIPFDTVPLKTQDIETLLKTDSQSVHFFSASTIEGKWIADAEAKAFSQQSNNQQAKDELANWIRFSDKDVNEKRDGLSPAGMGIRGFGGFVVRNFFKPEDSKKQSFVDQGIKKTANLTKNCGGWIVITGRDNQTADWLRAGMIYERLNLSCRKLNLGFHPMNQLVEEAEFKAATTAKLKLPGFILFVARVGYVAEYPLPVSLRRPVESFSKFN